MAQQPGMIPHHMRAPGAARPLLAGAVIMLGGWLHTGTARAHSIMTLDLYRLCSSPEPGSQSACRFYILGAAEGATASWLTGPRMPLFCIPDGASSEDLRLTFLHGADREAAERPTVGGISAVATLLYAFEHAYACKEAGAAKPAQTQYQPGMKPAHDAG